MPFLSATPHHNDAIFNILIWSHFGETIVIKSFLRAGRGSRSTKKYHVVAWDLIPLMLRRSRRRGERERGKENAEASDRELINGNHWRHIAMCTRHRSDPILCPHHEIEIYCASDFHVARQDKTPSPNANGTTFLFTSLNGLDELLLGTGNFS